MFDSPDFLFGKALRAALLAGFLLPVIGRHLVLGRAVLLGLVIPQIAMCGMAFVFLAHAREWGWAQPLEEESAKALVGSLLFGVPGLLIIASPWRRSAQLNEAWLAFLYLASVASANLMLSSDAVGETYLSDLFHGRLLFISDESLRLLGIVLGVGFFLALAFRRRILLVLTDADFAHVTGVAVGGWMLAVTLLNGGVIGVSVASAGPLVTFGFLVLPVLTASAVTRSLRTNLWASSVIGLLTAALGFLLSYRCDFPLGDCVVATGCAILLVVRLLAAAARKISQPA